jgi:predicted glycoside hydrolase/deacetylase ChbG (UPF0249 family)
MIIVNADDWGRSRLETDLTFACYTSGRITSVTAMVFMEDSERAANLANVGGINPGLHLNLYECFKATRVPMKLVERHERIVKYLKQGKYSQVLYNPLLRNHFKYVYRAQVEEFVRLYGKEPTHVDGHHHMHLCANMLLDLIIPRGSKVRRSFSFSPGEKSALNRAYRSMVCRWLRHRYIISDYLFSLGHCLSPQQMSRVIELARHATVELMVHPFVAAEYRYLTSDQYLEWFRATPKGTYADL